MIKTFQIVIQSILFVLLIHTYLHAQSIGDWKVYSSYSTINSVSTSDTDLYYALTQGGLFIIDDNIITSRFTTIDGMHRLDGSHSVYDDEFDRLIIAYPNGVIDLFDTNTRTFQQINDIERVSEFTSKAINDIQIINDEILFATNFGVVAFDRNEFFVTNSYLNLGILSRGTAVNDIAMLRDTIYVATRNGIASASISSNLVDATNWSNTSLSTSNNTEVTAIEATTSKIYAITNDSLYMWDNGIWEEFLDQAINSPSILESSSDKILVANTDKVIVISDNGLVNSRYETESGTITTVTDTETSLLVGTREQGLIEVGTPDMIYNPSGPYLNFFSELTFKDGTLLASATDQFPQSDPFNSIRGYYVLVDNMWNNFNRNTNSTLQDFRYSTAYTIDITTENFVIGSWGDGIALHSREDDEITIFDNSNSGLSGISANRSFVVISGLDSDSQENIWAISFISNLPLNVYSQELKEWGHFPSLPINNDALYFRLFIDSKDKLWIPLIDIGNNGQGLLIIDPGDDLFDAADDTYRTLTSGTNSGNLPDDNVIALVEDNIGEIWIGTTRGIARFIFPDFIIESNNPSEFSAQWLINADTSATSRFLLRDINVSSIAVNSANQKWVGSANQGLWLLNEDGSAILARYTSENSPLISNNIQDITINDKTGEVFISTDLGLVSIIETAIEATRSMDELKVYPNPFVYEKHNQIIIEDLSNTTTIKILGAEGSVLTSLETKGGRIIWNGLDEYGNQLASGVYFVVAIDQDGSEKGIGKLVMIR